MRTNLPVLNKSHGQQLSISRQQSQLYQSTPLQPVSSIFQVLEQYHSNDDNAKSFEIVLPDIQDPTKTCSRNYRSHQQIKKINDFFSIDTHIKQNKPKNEESMYKMREKQQKFMSKFLNGLSERNELKLVSAVMDIIHLAIQKNKVVPLLEAYFVLAFIYNQFGKTTDALNLFINLNNVANYRVDFKLKIRINLEIASIMSHMNQHKESISLLKKALSYAWYISDSAEEIKIYELLGIENYNLVEMSRASFYHLRSIQNLTESDRSQSFLNSQQFLTKHFKFYQHHVSRYQSIKSNMLNKLCIEYDEQVTWNIPNPVIIDESHIEEDLQPTTSNPQNNRRKCIVTKFKKDGFQSSKTLLSQTNKYGEVKQQNIIKRNKRKHLVLNSILSYDQLMQNFWASPENQFQVLSPRTTKKIGNIDDTEVTFKDSNRIQQIKKQRFLHINTQQLERDRKKNVSEILNIKREKEGKVQGMGMKGVNIDLHVDSDEIYKRSLNFSHQSQNRSLQAYKFQYNLNFKQLHQFYIEAMSLFVLYQHKNQNVDFRDSFRNDTDNSDINSCL